MGTLTFPQGRVITRSNQPNRRPTHLDRQMWFLWHWWVFVSTLTGGDMRELHMLVSFSLFQTRYCISTSFLALNTHYIRSLSSPKGAEVTCRNLGTQNIPRTGRKEKPFGFSDKNGASQLWNSIECSEGWKRLRTKGKKKRNPASFLWWCGM